MLKAFVRDGRCFFCARSDPGIFMPFLWDLGGEPYGREQNQGITVEIGGDTTKLQTALQKIGATGEKL